MRCRNVVISDRYRNRWGTKFQISNEQFTKIKFANNKTGWKLATSVGGIGVGERGDRFIIDDANNTMEMESEQVRYSTNMWFTEVVPDRLNSLKDSCIIVIQQRLHEEDVSGVALARDMGYVHLCIPMEYVPCQHVNGYDLDAMGRVCIRTFLGDEIEEIVSDVDPDTGPKPGDFFWEDPRTVDGELAWPGRFPQEVCEQIKNDKGAYAWTGQYQQDPEPRGGAIIKRAYWQPWTEPKYPNLEFILASLDTAYTEKQENDASALTIWGLFRDEAGNPKIILMHAWEERMEFHALCQRVIDTCTRDQRALTCPRFPVDKLLVEGKASGISLAQEIKRMVTGSGSFGVDIIDPKKFGDKVARANAVEHLFEDGMIYAPNKTWAEKVINQCAIFPKGSRNDYVDSTTMALRYLRDCGFALRREEHAMDVDEGMLLQSPIQSLYPC
jgi:predicted phage terminase large subunit-like protein